MIHSTIFTTAFILLCGLSSAAQEWTELKRSFDLAWETGEGDRRQEAIRSLATADRVEAARTLIHAARSIDRTLESLQEKLEAILLEIRKFPIDRYYEGEKQVRSAYESRWGLEREARRIRGETVSLNALLSAISKALSGYRDPAAMAAVVEEFEGGVSLAVRCALAGSLARMPVAVSADALARVVAGARQTSVVVAALEALAEQGGAAAVKSALQALSHPSWSVQCAAASMLLWMDDVSAVKPLIDKLDGVDGRVRDTFNRALVSLTGEDRHGDPAAWKEWWSRGGEGLAQSRPTLDERRRKLEAVRQGLNQGNTTFYGVPVLSKRVVFLVDRSGSMGDHAAWRPAAGVATGEGLEPPPSGRRKIDVCRQELWRAIGLLDKDARFNVLFFNRDVRRFRPDPLVPAGADNRRLALRFVLEHEPVGATNIFDAVESVLAAAARDTAASRPDTLFLLTDGAPTCGQIEDPDEVIREIRRINEPIRVRINAIYVGTSASGRRLMEVLARDSGGAFVDRSKAEK